MALAPEFRKYNFRFPILNDFWVAAHRLVSAKVSNFCVLSRFGETSGTVRTDRLVLWERIPNMVPDPGFIIPHHEASF